jgi:hypothetical protein
MLKILRFIVLPLALATTGAAARDTALLPDPMPPPTGEPVPSPPRPEMPLPPEPVPDPSPTPTAPPTEPVPPTAQAEPSATLVRDYPLCSATVQDSCINPSEAPATKNKTRRRPNRG